MAKRQHPDPKDGQLQPPNQGGASDADTCKSPDHPPPEEKLGGGDICSLEEQPSTDDDTPLD